MSKQYDPNQAQREKDIWNIYDDKGSTCVAIYNKWVSSRGGNMSGEF